MGYYIRVLGTNPVNIPVEQLRDLARPALVEADESTGDVWGQIVLKHEAGPEIAVIERNIVVDGDLGAEELQEFLEEVPLHRPRSAAAWLQTFLPTVKVIYAFQLLGGTDVGDGWTPLHSVYDAVWKLAGGILQADGEGFSNEQGYTILWQFGETAKGPWNVGVLVDDCWVHFEMDLGDEQHRKAFRQGQIPVGVKVF